MDGRFNQDHAMGTVAWISWMLQETWIGNTHGIFGIMDSTAEMDEDRKQCYAMDALYWTQWILQERRNEKAFNLSRRVCSYGVLIFIGLCTTVRIYSNGTLSPAI